MPKLQRHNKRAFQNECSLEPSQTVFSVPNFRDHGTLQMAFGQFQTKMLLLSALLFCSRIILKKFYGS